MATELGRSSAAIERALRARDLDGARTGPRDDTRIAGVQRPRVGWRAYVPRGESEGTGIALKRAPRHETESTPSLVISSSLHPSERT